MAKNGNGEGSIYPHKKNGKKVGYRGAYWVHTAEGPKRRYVSGKTRDEVHDKLIEALGSRAQGLVFDAGSITVGEYLTRWLKDSVRGTVRVSTYEVHRHMIQPHIVPALGRLKLKDLNPAHVRALYREKLDSGLSSATVRKMHSILRKALKQAVLDGLIPRNVCDAVTAPRQTKKEMQPLTPAQAKRLFENVREDRLRALYVLAITAGLREGELLGLRWEDVNLERGLLQVRQQLTRTRDGLSFTAPKRGKARVVRLTDMAIAALKAHREAQNEERARAGSLWEETSLVFTSTIGTPVDVGNLTYRSFRPLLKRTNLPRIRFHDLRHTCATLLLSKGTHPKIVQEMLGHANISMTMDTYSHVLPDMQEKAVSAMDDVLS
jgi:integrase